MRKRVFLKSPVRENRTPGSVRGLSGDWQSYRDGGVMRYWAKDSEKWYN
jgi:hypothetical protein